MIRIAACTILMGTALLAAAHAQAGEVMIPFDLPYAEGVRRYDDATVRFDQHWQPTVVNNEPTYGIRSDEPGARIELDFIGTSVQLIHQAGQVGAWGVIASDTGQPFGLTSVAVDGKPAAQIDNAVTIDAQGRAVVDTSLSGRTALVRGLPPGPHHLTLSNLGGPMVVVGFQVDTEPCENPLTRRAWRCADAVRCSDSWRERAAQWAATVNDEQGLARLEAMVAASCELDTATARLHALCVQAPPSPMVTREKECWTPNAQTRAYLDRLAALKKRVDHQTAHVDAFCFESLEDPRFTSLLADLRTLDRDVD
ncbi:MAG: hypothetical protein GY809_20350, partial [Planctomycetes bacterium]|nr:hypothetical protein [Planctomycetota bacterium]